MNQPSLPLELHQLIIDIIIDDAGLAQQAVYREGEDTRGSLGACSLVCKNWHAHTLRYIFHRVHFTLVDSDEDLTRRAELFRLLEVNPLIRRCIRRAHIYLSISVSPDGVEALCNAISPVETFSLVLESSQLDLPSPSPLDSLHPILSTSHLRNLSIWSRYFPTRMLEGLANLQSLTLEGVKVVVFNHKARDGREDGVWRSSTLERLVVTPARRFLAKIGSVADSNIGLSAFFEHLKYLDIAFDTDEMALNSSWNILLARWKRLETLIVRWHVLGEFVSTHQFGATADTDRFALTENGVSFLEMCRMLPWESFQGLRSLSYYIFYRVMPSERLFNAEVDPSALIFAGPSSLPQLQNLHVTYYNRDVLYEANELNMSLDAIYLHNLNRTIEERNSFPSLRNFHTNVTCFVSCDGELVLEEDELAQLVVDRLPAIFRVGGRKETHGWIASIESVVKTVTWS